MFLTLEDPRAKVKGSRDPLGTVPIMSAFARHFVTNLTGTTRSVRGFTTVLLGRYYGEKLIAEGRATEDDALPIFLRMEQVAGYVRQEFGEDDETPRVLGIARVRRNLMEHGPRPPIGLEPGIPILSNQKVYGLWGLYSVSARASGLLADGPVGLTPAGRAFVEAQYRPHLEPFETEIERLALRGGRLDLGVQGRLAEALSHCLIEVYSSGEREFYEVHLRDAAEVPDRRGAEHQRVVAELMTGIGLEDVGHESFELLLTRARTQLDSLATSLERARRLSALVAPADILFRHLLTRDRQPIGDIADDLDDLWSRTFPGLEAMPFEELQAEVGAVSSTDLAAVMTAADRAIATRDWGEAIEALLKWNKIVMAARGSAPWVRLEGDRIDVRFRSQEEPLPTDHELDQVWREPYFLGSLLTITRQLQGDAR